MNAQVATKIAKARAGLIITQPFFASILLPMPISENAEIKTMQTDGESIEYNPKWTESLSLPEVTFVLAHEVLHCVFDHMGRRGSRGPNRWNQAADYVINELLINDGVGSMPHGGLYNPSLTRQGGGTTEGVYALIPEENEGNEAGSPGGSMDEVHDAGSNNGNQPADQATMAEKSAQLKVRVIAAKNAAKMAGKLSSDLERLVEDLVAPQFDWREILRQFVSERAKVDFSFAKPKRRFLAEDIYLPSLVGEKMGELVVGIDVSGSVNPELLREFVSEIGAIREDMMPQKLTVMYFDSRVCGVDVFEPDDEFTIKLRGGGGTAFSPVFEKIGALDSVPVCVVILTDLECGDFGPTPDYPVLWACTGSVPDYVTVPFGEVVEMKE